MDFIFSQIVGVYDQVEAVRVDLDGRRPTIVNVGGRQGDPTAAVKYFNVSDGSIL